MSPSIQSPIFVIGCPRSGTGLLHQVLRLHPDLAWVTPVSNWVCGKSWFRSVPPRPAYGLDLVLRRLPAPLVPRFLQGPHDGSLQVPGIPETREGHSIWNRYATDRPHHAWTEADVTEAIRQDLRDVVRWHLAYHQRPRFLNKTPRTSLRISFFRAVFPTARFIHLVRDGRAVVASILKRRLRSHGDLNAWWGARPPGWQSVRSEPPVRQAARMWTTFLDTIEEDTASLPSEAVHRVHYETFAREPRSTVQELFDWADLDPAAFFGSEAPIHLDKIYPPPESWRERLTEAQKEKLGVLDPYLERYGYPPTGASQSG